MQKHVLLLTLMLLCVSLTAQISTPGTPYGLQKNMTVSEVPVTQTPPVDLAKIAAEDAVNDLEPSLPFRFGIEHSVSLNMKNAGYWKSTPDGGRIWRLAIRAPQALSINLIFDDFFLPKGTKFFLHNQDYSQILGAFTARNNKPDRSFATALVYGEATYLEYYQPPQVSEEAAISISTVVHGYRSIFDKSNNSLGSSGACNIDVICPQGDNWRDEIKAVGKTIAGGGLCSGTLVGNTTGDTRPLFLTANHCGFSNAVVVYWNFERPNCGAGAPDDTQTTSGAILRSDVDGTPGGGVRGADHLLMELSENPADAYDVYFAGWDAGGTTPQMVTGIHHPAGDAKKISMENNPLTSTTYGSPTPNPAAPHWRVGDWDSGTTEGGSSGSGLFDNTTKRLVGMLSGGGAACGNDSPDWYGKFSYAWLNDGAPNAGQRLKDWLDPNNTGLLAINGYAPGGGVTNGTCGNPLAISCGDNRNGDTNDGQNNLTDYGTFTNRTGPELIYAFQTAGGTVDIQLSGLNADLDLFLVEDCTDPVTGADVVASSTIGGTVTENISQNLIAGTYYIIVDGNQGATSTFNLSLTCTSTNGTCGNPIALNCGDNVNGTNADGGSNINTYFDDQSWTGPELIYEIQIPAGNVDIQLTGLTADLDLFLVSDCTNANGNLVASSTSSGNSEAINTTVTAGTYYILVDGYLGATSTFNLAVTCSTPGTCTDPIAIACGDNANGNNGNGTSTIDAYDDNNATAPELIYTFQTAGGQIDIQLTGLAADLDLFLLTSCTVPVGAGDLVAASIEGGTTAEMISQTLAAGTYFIAVDGFDGATSDFNLSITCSGAIGTCNNPIALACGGNLNGNNADGGSNLSTYFGDADWTGPELIYEFQAPGGVVDFVLTGLTADLDLFLVTDCKAPNNTLLASSTTTSNQESISTNLVAGTYYLVVEGFDGATSTFSLSATCSGTPGTFDNPIAIACGELQAGNTNDGQNNFDTHSGFSDWTGPELFYSFQAPGGDVTVELSRLDVDMDLFIITDASDPNGSEVASSEGSGNQTELINTNLATGNYFIMVDGYDGVAGPFDLKVTCGGPDNGCSPVPLDISDNPITAGTYRSSSTITSDGTVASQSTVTFEAEQSITLTAGFTAETGATFTARIQECLEANREEVAEIRTEQPRPVLLDKISVFPNPFTDQTTVILDLAEDSEVDIRLYDMTGKLLSTVLPTNIQPAGINEYKVEGHQLVPGMYNLAVRIGEEMQFKRLVVVR
jgi:hypothetical protein